MMSMKSPTMMRLLRAGVALALAIGAGCTASPAPQSKFTPSTDGKKLIDYGQDWPNTAYVRAHIHEMEKRPWDGIVIAVSKDPAPKYPADSIGFHAFSHERFDIPDFQHAIDDLRATDFKRFTDNFIQIESEPGDVDFFDDAGWANIAHNLKTLAHIAKQGGCKGFEFDPEEYGVHHIWSYVSWPESVQKKHTEDEYIVEVRKRGQEVMRAINSEFPDIKILCLFGPSATALRLTTNNHHYRLLAPFIDGMCSVATPGTHIIDGYEQSYGYRTAILFKDGRAAQKASRALLKDKAAFDRVMRVGFGLWMDNNSSHIGWFPNDVAKNYFQPDTWQTAIHYALAYSDKYVWTWHEKFDLWSGKNVNVDYLTAQEAARQKPGRIVTPAPRERVNVPRAADVKGHDDAATFADLLKSDTLLLSLPNDGWSFKPDPTNSGIKDHFFDPDLSTSDWKPIRINQFWDEQGYDYNGVAWYRRTFDVPSVPQGTKVILSLGAVDESATVWLNGKQVAHHDVGEGGWEQRIDCDVTNAIQPGQNQITVRVLNRSGPGGIWKSVKLFSTR
jgi:hypothetical protein